MTTVTIDIQEHNKLKQDSERASLIAELGIWFDESGEPTKDGCSHEKETAFAHIDAMIALKKHSLASIEAGIREAARDRRLEMCARMESIRCSE